MGRPRLADGDDYCADILDRHQDGGRGLLRIYWDDGVLHVPAEGVAAIFAHCADRGYYARRRGGLGVHLPRAEDQHAAEPRNLVRGIVHVVLRGHYELLWIVAFVVVAVFIVADRFTVAGLGKEVATNVGLNYDRVILLGTGLIAIATGVVTVVVGNLPFLGLIVPNVVSMIRGDDLRSNLPWVCLLGIALVTVCDLIGRTIIMPFEVPVSLILGVVGAVVFIFLLLRQRKHG